MSDQWVEVDRMNKEAKKAPPIDALAASRIGKRLRESYDKIVHEPVPDRFSQLLAQLEEQENDDGKGS